MKVNKQNRSRIVSLRLTQAEFKNIEAITKREKLTTSQLVRISLASLK